MPAPTITRSVSTSAIGVTSVTLSTLLVDGSDTLIVVEAGAGDSVLSARQVTTCTHHALTCTKQWEGDDANWDNSQGWTRVAPDAGTWDVVVTWNATGSENLRAAGVTLINGANQGGGASTFGTPVSGAARNTANTIAVGSAVGEIVISGTATDDESGITAGQTQIWKIQNLGSDTSYGQQWAAGAASVTMAWTQDILGWASGGVSIKGVGGAAFRAVPNKPILQAVKRATEW